MKKLTLLFLFISSVSVYGSGVESEVEPTVWSENSEVLSCDPKILRKDGSLVMLLGKGHGRELAIRRNSDNRWYFLVVGSAPETMKTLMSPSVFEKAKKVTISDKTVGFPWEKDGKNEVIFKQAGKYTVHVSEVLESEWGGFSCDVDYKID